MADNSLYGAALEWIWGPWCSEGQMGARVGMNNVCEIEVEKLPGPLGYYEVAIIRRDDGSADEIMPLHMAEAFRLMARN